eukprot:TRINITY_DN1566_c0_g1_i1.p1 TRINITY_DN1566_c0_g1~~TRINITY_DN1566_c0_g1_i1.p1  ORF type:complete len:1053 (+),score=227.95 TRINITY_DN1566_c0_g1_i1:272-3430(+)
MEASQLHIILQNTFNPDTPTRTHAEQLLKQAESQPTFVSTIFQVVQHPGVDEGVRQAASIRLKRKICTCDWNADNSVIQDTEKELLKSNLLHCIATTPHKVRSQLLEVLRAILIYDFPQRWPKLIDDLVQCLQQDNVTYINGALSALRVLTKRFEYKGDKEARKPLHVIVERSFPILANLSQYITSQHAGSEEAAEMQKTMLKIFWSSSQLELPEILLKDTALFNSWMEVMLQVLVRPVSTEDTSSSQWKSKKWVGHILQRLLERYCNLRSASTTKIEKQFGQAFLQTYAIKFLEGFLMVIDSHRQGKFVSPQVLTTALNFILNALDFKVTYAVILGNLDALLFNIIFPLLRYTPADAELWEDNPQEYLRKLFDPIEDVYNPRHAAMNLLLRLATPVKEYHSKEILPKILHHIAGLLEQYLVAPPESKDHATKDGVLFVVGSLRHKLLKKPEYAANLEGLLARHVLPEFTSQHGFLRAKAIWTVSRFTALEFKDVNNFNIIVQADLHLLKDPELPVRVQAGTCLRRLLKNKQSVEIVSPILPQLVEQLFSLMNEVDLDDLVATLELVIDRFGDNMVPAAMALLAKLTEYFTKVSPNIPENYNEEEDDDGDFPEQEEGLMAAAASLQAISALLTAVSDHKELFPQFEQVLVPFLKHLMNPEKLEYFDDALEILSRHLFYGKQVSPAMWEFFPHLASALDTWAADWLSNLLPTFDNFISSAPHQFITGTDPSSGKRYIQILFEVLAKVLSSEENKNDFPIAPKLISSLLQHSKQFQAELNPVLEQFFNLILQTLHTYPDLRLGFRILCYDVIADGLYYNAELMVGYLESKGVLRPVVDSWIATVPKYHRIYDQKVASLGLTALFEAIAHKGTGWLPAYLNPELLKLLLGVDIKLISDTHKAYQEEDEDDDDDDDDEDDSDWDDDTDDELDDEADIAGGAEGDPTEGLVFGSDADKSKFISKLQSEEDDDAIPLEDVLDDEDYHTPIDDVEEAVYFRDVMTHLGGAQQQLYGMLFHDMSEQTRKTITEAAAAAEKRLQEEREEQEKERQKKAGQQ